MAEILVVDDDRFIRKQKKELLEGEGFAVRTARNGEEALEAIYVRRPDLVLLDGQMPRRSGFSVCEEIRKVDRLLPVIFLTAYAGDVNELRARCGGADDFFEKDVSDDVLVAAVKRAIARANPPSSAPSRASAAKYMLGDVTVDLGTMTLSGPKLNERITRTETEILRILLSERGRVYKSEELADLIGGEDYFAISSLRSHVHNLKTKLGRWGNLIVCDRYSGYRIVTDD